jgi:hypothetical protein
VASLDAVLFGDGGLVGPDSSNLFDDINPRISAEQHVDKLLLDAQTGVAAEKDAVWSQLSQLMKATSPADSTPSQRLYQQEQSRAAGELIGVRNKSGEDAVYALAAKSSVYPKILREQ